MKIRNIKFHVKLKHNFVHNSNLQLTHTVFKKKIQNFSVTITIFKRNPKLLNVTGVKSFKEMKLFLREIFPMYDSYRLDTVFYLQKKKKTSNLLYLAHHLKNNFEDLYRIDYNPEIFSGIFMKPRSTLYPTVICHITSYIMLSRFQIFYIIPIKKKLDLLLGI